MMRVTTFTVLFLLVAAPTLAIDAKGVAESHVERAHNRMNSCLNGAADQLGVGRCYGDIIKQLSRTVRRAIEDLDSDSQAAAMAKASDDLWLKLKAAECDAAAKARMQGSGQGIHIQTCEITLLAARLDTMRAPVR